MRPNHSGGSGRRRRVACCVFDDSQGNGTVVGGLDVVGVDADASITKVKPPKRVLCPKNQVTPKSSNSCTLSRRAISPCANRILVNVSSSQRDAATSMRSSTMSCPVRWWRGVGQGGMGARMKDGHAGLAHRQRAISRFRFAFLRPVRRSWWV